MIAESKRNDTKKGKYLKKGIQSDVIRKRKWHPFCVSRLFFEDVMFLLGHIILWGGGSL